MLSFGLQNPAKNMGNFSLGNQLVEFHKVQLQSIQHTVQSIQTWSTILSQ